MGAVLHVESHPVLNRKRADSSRIKKSEKRFTKPLRRKASPKTCLSSLLPFWKVKQPYDPRKYLFLANQRQRNAVWKPAKCGKRKPKFMLLLCSAHVTFSMATMMATIS